MRISLLPVLILISAAASFAQIDNFALRREIIGAEPGWAKIALPDEIFARLSPAMTDIRVVGVREGGERFEVPYLLRQTAEYSEREVAFKVLNKARGDGGHFVTFQNESGGTLNLIDLSFSKENFDWRVRLEGSNDQRSWFTVLDGYRIVGFRNNFTNYNFTTLRFADSEFRFFRLFVPSADDPEFVRASLVRRTSNEAALRSYEVKSFRVSEDKPYRSSVIDIDLANRVPITTLKLRVAGATDYYRPISIEYVAGTNPDNQSVYRRGAADILSSFDREGLRFPVFVADKIRISISNQDSPPLQFEAVEIAGTPYEIVAQFPEKARYFLVYSKPETPKPQYDVANFADRIPEQIAVLTLGPEEASGDSAPAASPLLKSPLWIWPVLIIAIALMGFFAYRMLRSA